MYAFSRGLPPSPAAMGMSICQMCQLGVRTGIRTRFFNSSSFLNASRKPLPKTKIATTSAQATAATPPTLTKPKFTSLASQLAAKSSETLVFDGKASRSYVAACYSIAAFGFGYAIVNSSLTKLDENRDIPRWVPYVTLFGCFFFVVGGTFVLFRPAGLVRTIHALPSKAGEPLQVRLRARRTVHIPFFPLKERVVPASSIHLRTPIIPQNMNYQEAIRRERIRQMNAEVESTKWYQNPLDHASRGLQRFFRSFVRVFAADGFTKAEIENIPGQLLIDHERGWMLDEGKALDRLFGSTVTRA